MSRLGFMGMMMMGCVRDAASLLGMEGMMMRFIGHVSKQSLWIRFR